MSIQDTGSTGKAGVKTLAIRLEPETHAQLSLIAQLRGNTITDEIKAALDAHITAAKTMPQLTGRAEAVLAEIERDATAKRAAIATLFGGGQATTAAPVSIAETADRAAGIESTPDATAAAAAPSARSRGRKDSSSDPVVKDS